MGASEPKIPDHVAAYAAGLWSSGATSWEDISAVVDKVGLGRYSVGKLSRKALEWLAKNVGPEGRRLIQEARARAAYPAEWA